MPFPNQLNTYPAPGIPGDFASLNTNKFSVIFAGNGLVSGASGVTIAAFCWVDFGTGVANSYGSGLPAGFVHRNQQGLITTFLTENGYVIAPGYPMAAMSSGDFWVKNSGTTVAIPGQKAYANYTNGSVTFAATGTPPSGGSVVGSITSNTATFTASIAIPPTPLNAPGTMTVTAVSAGTLTAGMVVTGLTGVAAGTSIVSQLTESTAGTFGQLGTYEVSVPQTVVSSTGTGTNGLLTIASTASGSLSVGDVFTSSGTVAAGTVLTQIGTYNGTSGTAYVSPSQTQASATLTASSAIETKFVCLSYGQPGESVIMSSTALG